MRDTPTAILLYKNTPTTSPGRRRSLTPDQVGDVLAAWANA